MFKEYKYVTSSDLITAERELKSNIYNIAKNTPFEISILFIASIMHDNEISAQLNIKNETYMTPDDIDKYKPILNNIFDLVQSFKYNGYIETID